MVNPGTISKRNLSFQLCLRIAQEEWERIPLPQDIDFDLDKNLSLNNGTFSNELCSIIHSILRTLPTNTQTLKQLYQYLSTLSTLQTPREIYKRNVILSLIRWVFQEITYRNLCGLSLNSASLANKLSRHEGWLAKYGLEAEDCTQQLGDCLFDNLATQLHVSSKELRQSLAQFMQLHSSEYKARPDYTQNNNYLLVAEGEQSLFYQSWEEYLEAIAQPQVWATELEISALAHMLEHPIVLMSDGIKPKIYLPNDNNPPLFLQHLHGNHFTSCVPFKGLTPSEIYQMLKKEC